MVECKALCDIDSTLASVGSRKKGDVFSVPEYVAQHLMDIHPPQVSLLSPKPHGASLGGMKARSVSSSQEAPASPPKMLDASPQRTKKGGAKSSR